MSVTTIDSSPSQDYTHPDDQTTPSNSTPGLKPFTLSDCYVKAGKYEIQKPSTCRATWANLLRDKLWVWWKTSNKAKICFIKVDPRSTFRNKFLQSVTNVFVARQVDHAWWKTGNIDQNLQRNNVARQVEGFCISYFAAFSISRIFSL